MRSHRKTLLDTITERAVEMWKKRTGLTNAAGHDEEWFDCWFEEADKFLAELYDEGLFATAAKVEDLISEQKKFCGR